MTLAAAGALAAVVLAGCGTSTDTRTATTPTSVRTAKATSAPYAFMVAGDTVTVVVDAAQRAPSSRDEPVQLICANLAANGFADRDQAGGTWKVGASSATVSLPKSANGLDLCAINFTAHAGMRVAAFVSPQAEATHLADQKVSN